MNWSCCETVSIFLCIYINFLFIFAMLYCNQLKTTNMKAYLIIFAIVFSIAIVSGIVNVIAEKKDVNSFTFEISNLLANGFGLVSIFMFTWGLLCIFC